MTFEEDLRQVSRDLKAAMAASFLAEDAVERGPYDLSGVSAPSSIRGMLADLSATSAKLGAQLTERSPIPPKFFADLSTEEAHVLYKAALAGEQLPTSPKAPSETGLPPSRASSRAMTATFSTVATSTSSTAPRGAGGRKRA